MSRQIVLHLISQNVIGVQNMIGMDVAIVVATLSLLLRCCSFSDFQFAAVFLLFQMFGLLWCFCFSDFRFAEFVF